MFYDVMKEEGLDEAIDEGRDEALDGDNGELDSEPESVDFAPLLEIGEADRFSDVVARLERAGIPWFVENAGDATVLYVTMPRIEEARQLTR